MYSLHKGYEWIRAIVCVFWAFVMSSAVVDIPGGVMNNAQGHPQDGQILS